MEKKFNLLTFPGVFRSSVTTSGSMTAWFERFVGVVSCVCAFMRWLSIALMWFRFVELQSCDVVALKEHVSGSVIYTPRSD